MLALTNGIFSTPKNTNALGGSDPSPQNNTTDYRSNTQSESNQYQGFFTFGVNPHFKNKRALGSKEYYGIGWETKRGSIQDLLAWVGSGKAIMCGTLHNNRTSRKKFNVVSAQAIALDIDEGLSLEDCLKIPFVRDYAAAIYTSASHQKQKGDVAPCDRYRVVFILPVLVTDAPLYEAAVKVVMEEVGHADKACKDASRMFYGYDQTEIVLCDETKVLPANFLDEVSDRLEAEKAERKQRLEERRRYLANRSDDDKDRDFENIKLALDAINPDCSHNEWLKVGMALHDHDTSLFYLWDSWSSCGSKYPGSRSLERQWSKFTGGGGVTLGSLFEIAKQYGFKFPKRERSYSSKRNVGDRLVDAAEYGKRQLSEFLQHINNQAQAAASGFGKLLQVTQNPITEPPTVIKWRNGDPVPSPSDYGDRPIPEIVYARGSNALELIAKLKKAGWPSVMDDSFMGEGKSHRAGAIRLDFMTGWYIDTNHNNPSVQSVTDNFSNLWARHKGLWRDSEGELSRKHIEGREPEIPGNCPSADLFPKLAAKGYDFMSSKGSPICGACPHRGYCHKDERFFKAQRSATLSHKLIRADIQSLPNPLEWEYSNNFAIIEEATTQARAALVEVSGDRGDVLCNLADIEKSDSDLYEQLKPFRDALEKLFEAPQGRYGLNHEQIMEVLPREFNGDTEELLPLVMAALDPELALDLPDSVRGAGGKKDPFSYLQKQLNRQYRGEALENHDRAIQDLSNCILLPLLTVWTTGKGSIRLEHGKFTVTQADIRKQQTIQAFGFRIFLDATGNKQAIADGFGLDVNSIITIRQEQPPLDNLTVNQITMAGTKTRNRSDSAKERIEAYKRHWRSVDPNVQFLGFKGDADISGWWLNHNRGSNKFKGRVNLVSFGLPFPHVGAVQAEYRTFNGSLDGFDAYYHRLVADELIQFIGRQRVQHFSDRQFTLDIVGKFDDIDLSFLTERYGIKVIARDAAEVCAAAGTTKEQIKHSIFDIAKGINDAGGKITQKAIAAAMGIAQSTLSEHIKALWGNWLELKKLLSETLKDTYRESDKKSEPIEPVDPSIAAALLIECFAVGGVAGIRAYLEEMPPPDARYWLGCLLSATAIA